MCLFVCSFAQRRTGGFCFELCHCGLGYHNDSIQVWSHTKTSKVNWLPLHWMVLLWWFYHLRCKDFHCSLGFYLMAMDFEHSFSQICLLRRLFRWQHFSLFCVRPPLNRGRGFLYWGFSLCWEYHSDTFFIRHCTKSQSPVISVYKLYC